ncbi:class I SAM-dependent methyltransferase [Stieleria varia]|nr:class I SAM-dependent methyltransferase [Stieleria varia]
MIPRTLEPESMDTAEEADEYRKMNHEAVNACFVHDLFAGGAVGPRVLDLGTGPAHIPILICEKDPEVEIMAVDSSIEMLEVAKIEIELSGMIGRIQLEHGDAKNLSGFEQAAVDTVISNTLLHHLAEPGIAIAQAVKLLRPGGRLFLRDLFRPESDDEVERLVTLYADGESEQARQLFRQSLHAALTLSEIQSLVNDLPGGLGIPAQNVQMTSDRHWTIDWVMPASTT